MRLLEPAVESAKGADEARGSASHSVFKYLVLFSRYMGIVFPLVTVIARLGDWNAQECHQLKPLIAVCSTLGLAVFSLSLSHSRTSTLMDGVPRQSFSRPTFVSG